MEVIFEIKLEEWLIYTKVLNIVKLGDSWTLEVYVQYPHYLSSLV
jgi:hypothetical protein